MNSRCPECGECQSVAPGAAVRWLKMTGCTFRNNDAPNGPDAAFGLTPADQRMLDDNGLNDPTRYTRSR